MPFIEAADRTGTRRTRIKELITAIRYVTAVGGPGSTTGWQNSARRQPQLP
jgi:hypothetical protein